MRTRPRWISVLLRVLVIVLMIVSWEAGAGLLFFVYDQHRKHAPAPVPPLLIAVGILLVLWPMVVAVRFVARKLRARRERSGASRAA